MTRTLLILALLWKFNLYLYGTWHTLDTFDSRVACENTRTELTMLYKARHTANAMARREDMRDQFPSSDCWSYDGEEPNRDPEDPVRLDPT